MQSTDMVNIGSAASPVLVPLSTDELNLFLFQAHLDEEIRLGRVLTAAEKMALGRHLSGLSTGQQRYPAGLLRSTNLHAPSNL